MSVRKCARPGCTRQVPEGARRDALYCGKQCRQNRWKFRRALGARPPTDEPLRLAYADPPYPGLAHRYYSEHPDYAGEVDHRALLEQLIWYDGWALSTSSSALPMVLGLCTELGLEPRIAVWVRGGRGMRSAWPARTWEPVLFSGGRQVLDAPGAVDGSRLDSLVYAARPRRSDGPARVIGAKPAAFAFWLFDLLGARPGDRLVDLFPGSGGIGRAWFELEAGRK